MRKSFPFSAFVRLTVITALCAVAAACSDTTAPAVRDATLHAPAASPRAARASASDDSQGGSAPIAVFVIGDSEPTDIGATVNFWGAQWWKNNQMSDSVTAGVASFKGFATTSDNTCGGTWQSGPGNSYNPPATIDADVAVVVTSTVIKDGAAIHGTIKRIVMVHHDGGYGPNPGHSGNGVITTVVCNGHGTAT